MRNMGIKWKRVECRERSGDFVRTRALNASAEYPRINKHNSETQGNEWDMAALLRV